LQEQQKFNAAMQDLQYRQQLGTLDFQGQQQLQQMERSAQLNQQRDRLLQQFQNSNMDKQFLQQLEFSQLQWQRDDAVFAKNIDANAQAQYRATSAEAYNSYLEQVSAVYSNPNMTPQQHANAALTLKTQFDANLKALQAIFQFSAPAQPGIPNIPGDNGFDVPGLPDSPVPPGSYTNPVTQPPQNVTRPPQNNGGLLDFVTNPIDSIGPINFGVEYYER
jgi:hypothetical protein